MPVSLSKEQIINVLYRFACPIKCGEARFLQRKHHWKLHKSLDFYRDGIVIQYAGWNIVVVTEKERLAFEDTQPICIVGYLSVASVRLGQQGYLPPVPS